MVNVRFSGVAAAFQKVGIGDITPRHCNRVRLESFWSGGVVTVTNPVAVHLEDIKRGGLRVFKQVVELQVGTGRGPLGVKGDSPVLGDIAATHDCLCSAEIT